MKNVNVLYTWHSGIMQQVQLRCYMQSLIVPFEFIFRFMTYLTYILLKLCEVAIKYVGTCVANSMLYGKEYAWLCCGFMSMSIMWHNVSI